MGRPKVSRFGAKLTKGDSESHKRCNYSWPGDCVAASGVGREASIGYRVAGEWDAGWWRGWMRCSIVNELKRKNISGSSVTGRFGSRRNTENGLEIIAIPDTPRAKKLVH